MVFCFSDNHQAKYLGQHIGSPLFVVNQIPISLLGMWRYALANDFSYISAVGPSLPVSSVVPDLDLRYDTRMMSKPLPQFVGDLDRSLESLSQEEKLPLTRVKQGSGFDIGFFDRGVILGAVTIVLPTLGLLGYAGSQAASYAYRWCMK